VPRDPQRLSLRHDDSLSSASQPPLSWPAIDTQLDAGFKAIKHFMPNFLEAVSAATAAYPEARIEVGESGIALHPARSPLAQLVG
jgi:hypothetical protein